MPSAHSCDEAGKLREGYRKHRGNAESCLLRADRVVRISVPLFLFSALKRSHIVNHTRTSGTRTWGTGTRVVVGEVVASGDGIEEESRG